MFATHLAFLLVFFGVLALALAGLCFVSDTVYRLLDWYRWDQYRRLERRVHLNQQRQSGGWHRHGRIDRRTA